MGTFAVCCAPALFFEYRHKLSSTREVVGVLLETPYLENCYKGLGQFYSHVYITVMLEKDAGKWIVYGNPGIQFIDNVVIKKTRELFLTKHQCEELQIVFKCQYEFMGYASTNIESALEPIPESKVN